MKPTGDRPDRDYHVCKTWCEERGVRDDNVGEGESERASSRKRDDQGPVKQKLTLEASGGAAHLMRPPEGYLS